MADEIVTVYEGKEGYALVDALEWRTMKDEIDRLRAENQRLRGFLPKITENQSSRRVKVVEFEV